MEYNFESIELVNKNGRLMKKIRESKKLKNKIKRIVKKVVKR
jgi:hypothetical protein